jgi:putative endonuclease
MGRSERLAASRIGEAAERLVAERLERAGWTIVGRNVRLGRDELDLIAIDPAPPGALAVVEVRCRRRRDFGLPEETLDRRKRAALRRAVLTLMASAALPDGRRLPSLPLRVDLVAVDRTDDGRLVVRHHRGVRP